MPCQILMSVSFACNSASVVCLGGRGVIVRDVVVCERHARAVQSESPRRRAARGAWTIYRHSVVGSSGKALGVSCIYIWTDVETRI